MSTKYKKEELYCSFCGKNYKEVKKLIAGPTCFICDECIELCVDIIHEERAKLAKTSLAKFNKFHVPKTSLDKFNRFLQKD